VQKEKKNNLLPTCAQTINQHLMLSELCLLLCNCVDTVVLFVYIRMAATLFVQPLDLVKNRMQLSGQIFYF